MGTKKAAKKKKTKKVTRKKAATAARKRKAKRRLAVAGRHPEEMEPADEAADALPPHEHDEPRELTHDRLRNDPEETIPPPPDDDLLDDVAADLEETGRDKR